MNINTSISFGETKEDKKIRTERYRKIYQSALAQKIEQQNMQRFQTNKDNIAQTDTFMSSREKAMPVEISTTKTVLRPKKSNIFSRITERIKK